MSFDLSREEDRRRFLALYDPTLYIDDFVRFYYKPAIERGQNFFTGNLPATARREEVDIMLYMRTLGSSLPELGTQERWELVDNYLNFIDEDLQKLVDTFNKRARFLHRYKFLGNSYCRALLREAWEETRNLVRKTWQEYLESQTNITTA